MYFPNTEKRPKLLYCLLSFVVALGRHISFKIFKVRQIVYFFKFFKTVHGGISISCGWLSDSVKRISLYPSCLSFAASSRFVTPLIKIPYDYQRRMPHNMKRKAWEGVNLSVEHMIIVFDNLVFSTNRLRKTEKDVFK